MWLARGRFVRSMASLTAPLTATLRLPRTLSLQVLLCREWVALLNLSLSLRLSRAMCRGRFFARSMLGMLDGVRMLALMAGVVLRVGFSRCIITQRLLAGARLVSTIFGWLVGRITFGWLSGSLGRRLCAASCSRLLRVIAQRRSAFAVPEWGFRVDLLASRARALIVSCSVVRFAVVLVACCE
jgi:hypothetical protein